MSISIIIVCHCIPVSTRLLVYYKVHMCAIYLNIMEYVAVYLFLSDTKVSIRIIGMRAHMNDAIHIQIQVVKFWNLKP